MKYRVKGGTAEFGTDLVLILTKEQSSVRASSLDEVKGKPDAWKPHRKVQFKDGEELGVECPPEKLPAGLGRVLVVVTPDTDDKDAKPVAQTPQRRKRAAPKPGSKK